ncbi:MAG: TDP-fucosamine acetyltransferase [Acidimicrobiales bacterium]|jgi:ribosomal protein S18 acetylase RimI-like enzyme|nr:TDP-fucosamine acetyltransferase [Acidimicrobiales bacterium]
MPPLVPVRTRGERILCCLVPAPVTVQIATEATPALADAFARLIPQLSRSSPPPTVSELDEMVQSPASDVLLALDGDSGAILGTLTLVVFRIPTGVRAWIEDVVVDDDARGRGVGEALNQFALETARSKGAKTVDLTSRPSREAANRLYQRIGFVARETNIYRYDL